MKVHLGVHRARVDEGGEGPQSPLMTWGLPLPDKCPKLVGSAGTICSMCHKKSVEGMTVVGYVAKSCVEGCPSQKKQQSQNQVLKH